MYFLKLYQKRMAAVHDSSEKSENKTKSRRKMFNGVCSDIADETFRYFDFSLLY